MNEYTEIKISNCIGIWKITAICNLTIHQGSLFPP